MLKKWYFWVAIVLCLAAGGGVLYGVLTHKEPGFMGVCWKGGVVENYHDAITDPHKECTQLLKWKKNKLPITYYLAFGEDHKAYIKSVVAGADLWNQEIGVDLFMRVDSEPEAMVQVTWGGVVPREDHPGGRTTHSGGLEGATGAKVILVNPSDVHAVYRYAAHEWGHVLGLAHDNFKSSIMYHEQKDLTGEDLKFVLPSDHDKKLLKEAYR